MEQFTRREVLRILDLNEKQLAYWERLHLISPRKVWREKFYRFPDLIRLRTIKQLTDQRVPARHLRRALEALGQQLDQLEAPLTDLRILSDGRRLVVEHRGARLEPLSGQLLLNFDTHKLVENLRVMPERTPEEWFALALDSEGEAPTGALEAYRHVVEKRPDWVEAHINLGTLLYERGDWMPTAPGPTTPASVWLTAPPVPNSERQVRRRLEPFRRLLATSDSSSV